MLASISPVGFSCASFAAAQVHERPQFCVRYMNTRREDPRNVSVDWIPSHSSLPSPLFLVERFHAIFRGQSPAREPNVLWYDFVRGLCRKYVCLVSSILGILTPCCPSFLAHLSERTRKFLIFLLRHPGWNPICSAFLPLPLVPR